MAGLIVLADTQFHRWAVLQRSSQAAGDIGYQGSQVGVVETRSWLLHRHLSYEVYVGRDPALSYGHVVEVAMTGERPVMREAVWQPDGVRVRFASGHELFIPAEKFLGGR